jgi:hypothetical protein
MSHFTVAVLIDKDEKPESLQYLVSEALTLFDENSKGEIRIHKTKTDIVNEIKQKREKYKAELEAAILSEGKDSDSVKNIKKYINSYKRKTDIQIYKEYIKGEMVDDEGNLLTDYNPNSKWDWWVIGGRWAASLVVKESRMFEINGEKPDLIEEIKKNDKLVGADICRLEDIHLDETFKNMNREVEEVKKGFFEAFPNATQEDFEEYIEIEKYHFTYAILDLDGKWIEPGKMGWFGMSFGTPESEKQFRKYVRDYYKKIDPKTWIVLVDCHI